MKERFRRWLYYRIARLSVKAKWSRNKLPNLSETQLKLMDITLTLISNNECELLVNPIIDDRVGEKYYIKKNNSSDEVEKFITLTKLSTGWAISLIGHEIIDNDKYNYHFDVWFNDTCGSIITEKFTKVLKRRRNKMESDLRSGDEKTLNLILKKLKKY